MRGETGSRRFARNTKNISIHSPRAGRDKIILQPILDTHQFQSTLPVRGETHIPFEIFIADSDFNPLSPCGERLTASAIVPEPSNYFNPLSPCGERHCPECQESEDDKISIHSPRAGRDPRTRRRRAKRPHFNPLSPCGERP